MNDLKVINFMRLRSYASVLSLLLMLGSVGALAVKGINWGLDFTGGTLIELVYDQPVKTADIRDQLATAGYDNVVVQEFGSAEDILVRIPGDDPKMGASVAGLLGQNYDGNVEAVRVEFVGPQVGERLREQGGLGMLFAMLLITLYIAFRFQFKFSVGAILSLAHDVIFTLGLFALLGLQFDLTVMAALLAVIGYSLNDTIIVYDRIRENFRKLRKGDADEVINVSLTQTLGRTLATSGTTLMVLLALFLFGGEMIHNFALALIVGVGVGTYSSIYIASNMLIYMRISREDLIVPVKENEDSEQMP
ncbi:MULTISPECIES: protein translocase subunit SecF [Gammaproteobacteria]|uniref:protein translocase subunit SecF n=1 Tax=Gammaproteobacteria TaxID=1236 RepID=UPI000C75E239|nr:MULTISPECIES: protein translocase subunit SecF [Gammaproteobacteria]MBO9479807.1 protein translocase subunit SecF [Salinisphaera sp. G21_0]MBO9492695.1 protein translocase subunit SecF [Thalassotalea sp. G20_0]WBA83560.1 protein translocase subunit SecF [Endozoicomonas sp. GU-1]WBA86541.1 protein translocase subunit SecF [Endozoicomonas sp. GU-1]